MYEKYEMYEKIFIRHLNSRIQDRRDLHMKPLKFYGSTTVGERGQIVLPVTLRRDLDIKKRDTLIVIGNPHMKNIMLFNEDTMDKYLDFMSDNITQLKSKIRKK